VSMVCGLLILKLVLSGFMLHYIDTLNKVFSLGCTVIGTSCPGVFQ
jgi:flagellar biosynthesis protein FliR